MQSALVEITHRLGIAIELLLIESGSLLEHGSSRVVYRISKLFQVGEALAEGQMARQLDKANQIAALSAAVAVEEILASVDIERRPGFGVQRT